MNKAFFCTLDDTLIFTKSGKKYPIHSKDWIINIDVIDILKQNYGEGYKIIIIDNQDSVAHGYVDIRVFDEKIIEIVETLERACGIEPNHICYMFWTGDRDEYYRLPRPGIMYECALEYELDIGSSRMIGSSREDMILSDVSGVGSYLDVNEIK